MKRVLYYIVIMLVIVILLPSVIIRSCSLKENVETLPKGQKGVKIKVCVSAENKVKEMLLEEYIKGVVAAEMPAEFEAEALKAQAIAARTYAYGRMGKIYTAKEDTHQGGDICTDPGHCQAWVSRDAAMRKWKIFSALQYWNKISKAVKDTEGILILYHGEVVNPVFHSNSGGRTENIEDVWGGSGVPYLKSVVSKGEEVSSEYRNTVSIRITDFIHKVKKEYSNAKLTEKNIFKDIKVMGHTEGGRVKTIKIGNITLKGTEFRKLFSLKSANFTIDKSENNTMKITTVGNGHGVGMSQWGANALAKNGYNYEEILTYYYTGVELGKIGTNGTISSSH